MVFEICKGLHAADANEIRRNGWDHIVSRSECIFHESSAFAPFEVADKERSVSAVGTEGRWERERERETGWGIQRQYLLWTLQTILSTDGSAESHSGSLPLR